MGLGTTTFSPEPLQLFAAYHKPHFNIYKHYAYKIT